MNTSSKRVRKDFEPLSTSPSLVCSSSFSPVTQVFNAANGEYEPDRSVTPTVLQPIIIANAKDGSWHHRHANEYLTNIVWYVNGVNITTLNDWQGLYEIDTVGATKGTLTIYKNIPPGQKVSLHFEAELLDNRLNALHPIKTDSIILSTVDKSEDSYGISIGKGTAITYNPFLDKLYMYDYLVGCGLQAPSSAARQAALDENAYLREIPINLFKGATKLNSGYTIKLYRVNSLNSLTELAEELEVVSIQPTAIVLDLRIIKKEDYMIKAFVGAVEVARIQFSVAREVQAFHCTPGNETDIMPSQKQRYDVAQVDSNGKVVEHPEAIIAIVWYTDTAAKAAVRHNEGGHTIFDLGKTGIGDTAADSWLETSTDASLKEAHSIASDDQGNIFTDENGNIFIFN